MKMYLPALLTVVLLGSCGDAMRTPEYVGDPVMPLVVRVRLPDDFMPAVGSTLDFDLVNPPKNSSSSHRQATVTDPTAREYEAKFHGGFDSGPVGSLRGSLPASVPGSPGESSVSVDILRASMISGSRQAVSIHDFVIYSAEDVVAYPIGRGGPILTLKVGYQVVRRTCEASGAVRFETLPSNTVLDLVALPSNPRGQGGNLEIAAFASCGVTLPAVDLGNRLEVGPPRLYPGGMAFHPSDGRLFFLPDTTPDYSPISDLVAPQISGPQIDSVDLASVQIQTLLRGRFSGPLALSSDGRYLFAATADTDPRAEPTGHLGRIDTTTGALVKGPDSKLPSPDGRLAAYIRYERASERTELIIHDFDTGMARTLLPGVPLAWAPDSASLLAKRNMGRDTEALDIVKLDGTAQLLTSHRVSHDDVVSWFWHAGIPHALALDRVAGINLTSFGNGSSIPARTDTILSREEGANLRSDMSTVAAAPGLVFVWSERCLGFGPSMCTARLHRYVIAQGKSTVVAVARTPMPLAVSPDGRRLALASDGAIYVKELPDPAM